MQAQPPPRQPLLQAKDLIIGYASQRVAGPVSLSLYPGELTCLLGPNGAGKSTLLRTIAGLQPALGGEISIEEQRGPFSAAFLSTHLAVVLSAFEGIGGLRVEELVSLGRAPYSTWTGRLGANDKAVVAAALADTSMTALANRKVGTLSDGERQRAMIARALAQETPVIVLDEPTSHLDLAHRVQTMRLLHQLARGKGKAIVLSSHDLDLALQGADQLWVMSKSGEMVAGSVEDLILAGQLAETYGEGGQEFDWQTGGLRLLQEGQQALQIIANDELKSLIRRALPRLGWKEDPASAVHLFAEAPDVWKIQQNGETHLFASAGELGQWLRLQTQEAQGSVVQGK